MTYLLQNKTKIPYDIEEIRVKVDGQERDESDQFADD